MNKRMIAGELVKIAKSLIADENPHYGKTEFMEDDTPVSSAVVYINKYPEEKGPCYDVNCTLRCGVRNFRFDEVDKDSPKGTKMIIDRLNLTLKQLPKFEAAVKKQIDFLKKL